MSKNPLIPTQIVNKNGVLTTVHKKLDNGTGTGAPSLPAPCLTTQRAEALGRVITAIDRAYGKYDYSKYGVTDIDSLEYRLNNYSPAVIAAYDKAISGAPGEGFEDLLVSALHKRVSSEKAGFLLFIAQHDEEQEGDWNDEDQISYNYERALELYYGIKSLEGQYGFNVDDDAYRTNEYSAKAISALLIATTKVSDADQNGIAYMAVPGYGYTLNNNSLIELIVRRPEDAERIADISVQRGNPDAAVIEAVLDAEVPALSDGLI